MKKPLIPTFYLLLLVVFITSCVQKGELLVQVKYKQPYCGGARPTPEVLAEAEKEHNYANAKFILVNTNQKTYPISTNTEGLIKIKIPYGDYSLMEEWRNNKKIPGDEKLDNFDKDCLENEWKKVYLKFNFSKSTTLPLKPEIIELTCPNNYPCLKVDNQIPQRE
ncbi:MAG: hypothetical protein IPM51_14960 [Sphingobacteriaceae bacterium]|nr:hypothetical protein [Sphingobacteriaceae bacterium]